MEEYTVEELQAKYKYLREQHEVLAELSSNVIQIMAIYQEQAKSHGIDKNAQVNIEALTEATNILVNQLDDDI